MIEKTKPKPKFLKKNKDNYQKGEPCGMIMHVKRDEGRLRRKRSHGKHGKHGND